MQIPTQAKRHSEGEIDKNTYKSTNQTKKTEKDRYGNMQTTTQTDSQSEGDK